MRTGLGDALVSIEMSPMHHRYLIHYDFHHLNQLRYFSFKKWFHKRKLTSIYISSDNGVRKLENGVVVSGLRGNREQSAFFYIEVPHDAEYLRIITTGGTGDADMYVKFGGDPTLNDFDCRSHGLDNSESCVIEHPVSGAYHVMISSYSEFDGLTIRAFWYWHTWASMKMWAGPKVIDISTNHKPLYYEIWNPCWNSIYDLSILTFDNK